MMKMIRRNGNWIMALFAVVCLAFAAGVMADRPAANTGPDHDGVSHRGVADDLSASFRRVSKDAMPGIVSIQTRGKTVNINDDSMEGSPFENSPFGEMFKNDPRFKEFFQQRRQQPHRTQAMGSGFIVDPSGVVVTNAHVVRDAEDVTVKLSDGREFRAVDVKTDPRTDVAIIRIKPDSKLHALKFGNSDAVEVGDWVLAIGSPFGLDMTVTAGIISAKGRGPGITQREDFLQTDAAINPGNSGGPLLNLHGEVVGMNTAISTRSGGYDGVGFAVPVNLCRWVADQLITKGNVSRAYLGVGIQGINNSLAKQFHVQVGQGAVVTQVMPKSPAAEAQLQAGDLILKLDGKDVHSPRGLQGIVEQLTLGQKYPLVVMRNGKEVTLSIVAREMPSDYSYAMLDSGNGQKSEEPGKPSSKSFEDMGIGIEAITPEIARQLGDNSASGVLISSVKEESPADNAGLREGMIIEKVGTMQVNSPEDFAKALKDVSLEKGILMLVRVKNATQFVVVHANPAEVSK